MRGHFSALRALARTKPDDARALILKAAQLENGHKGKTATRLKVSTPTLWRIVKELGGGLDGEIEKIAIDAILDEAQLGG